MKPVTSDADGRYQRAASQFRHQIGDAGFPAEAGRYHLYVSLACPWAHRTLVMRKLKGLEELLPVSVVHWLMPDDGWNFKDGPGVIPDPIHHAARMADLYRIADPRYDGRITVPVLWDRQRDTIVNNESSEILRMLNSAFDGIGALPGDYYPAELRGEIDRINERVYETLNNGVYKAGFAASQAAYEEAVGPVFATLDWLEDLLATRRYVAGDRITEADIRLFTTLIRFDAVYHGHFKCNLRRIADYPHLSGFTREMYQFPGIADTVNFGHIKRHYYESHEMLNPSGIVPAGPVQDFALPHGRLLGAAL